MLNYFQITVNLPKDVLELAHVLLLWIFVQNAGTVGNPQFLLYFSQLFQSLLTLSIKEYFVSPQRGDLEVIRNWFRSQSSDFTEQSKQILMHPIHFSIITHTVPSDSLKRLRALKPKTLQIV